MSSEPEADAYDVGANYAALIYAAADTANTIAHQVWCNTYIDHTGQRLNPSTLEPLRLLHADAETHAATATTYSELLTQVRLCDTSDALDAFHTELEGRLIARLHKGIHNLASDPNRVCLHETCVPLPKQHQPLDTIDVLDTELTQLTTQGTPTEFAAHHIAIADAAYNAVSPALLDHTVNTRDEDARAHHAERLQAAHDNLTQLRLLGLRLEQLTVQQARTVLDELQTHHNHQVRRLIHNTWHQLQPDPRAPCLEPDCLRLQLPAALAQFLPDAS